MTDATVKDSRTVPSLAELRSGLAYSGLAKADPEMHAAFAALLDVAEAAQRVAYSSEIVDGVLMVRESDMERLDEALAKVRP